MVSNLARSGLVNDGQQRALGGIDGDLTRRPAADEDVIVCDVGGNAVR
jgi:hypothetical protein